MAQNTSLPFSIGEAVVYPNQGLCIVTGIEAQEVANQKLLFIHLVRQTDGTKVMIPTDKALGIGLRKIATHSEVLSVIEFLKSDSDKASLDWKARARTNTEHMARGSLMGLAEVVKALQVLSELRALPTKERELYNNARSMLVEEVAVALEMEPCDAEDTIDVVLFPVGKIRPRRTVEEFQLGLETPLLLLEEDALLQELEEDGLEEDDFEEESAEGAEEDEKDEKDKEDETDFAPSAKTSAAKEKKKGKANKTHSAKTTKRASAKPSSRKEAPTKTTKAVKDKAPKTKAASRASSSKKKPL
jgi:RNA polymerase-interacting CarD/CdnL/TRCF family regulator